MLKRDEICLLSCHKHRCYILYCATVAPFLTDYEGNIGFHDMIQSKPLQDSGGGWYLPSLS